MYLIPAIQSLNSGLNKSYQQGTKMNIAIVDKGGNLIAFAREDDAWVGSIDISIKKAKTSAFFCMPTGELGKLSQPGESLYGIEHSNGGLITFPGGIPLISPRGEFMGAVGVSGGTVEEDEEVAMVIADAFKTFDPSQMPQFDPDSPSPEEMK